jgi:hypothetical protein
LQASRFGAKLNMEFSGGSMRAVVLVAVAGLAACSPGSSDVEGFAPLERQIERQRVGGSQDHWIEMINGAGEWERTGLIFGYFGANGDYGECLKAIEGMRAANTDREYRCVPAN